MSTGDSSNELCWAARKTDPDRAEFVVLQMPVAYLPGGVHLVGAGWASVKQVAGEHGYVVPKPGVGVLDGALRADERVHSLEG